MTKHPKYHRVIIIQNQPHLRIFVAQTPRVAYVDDD